MVWFSLWIGNVMGQEGLPAAKLPFPLFCHPLAVASSVPLQHQTRELYVKLTNHQVDDKPKR